MSATDASTLSSRASPSAISDYKSVASQLRKDKLNQQNNNGGTSHHSQVRAALNSQQNNNVYRSWTGSPVPSSQSSNSFNKVIRLISPMKEAPCTVRDCRCGSDIVISNNDPNATPLMCGGPPEPPPPRMEECWSPPSCDGPMPAIPVPCNERECCDVPVTTFKQRVGPNETLVVRDDPCCGVGVSVLMITKAVLVLVVLIAFALLLHYYSLTYKKSRETLTVLLMLLTTLLVTRPKYFIFTLMMQTARAPEPCHPSRFDRRACKSY